MDAMINSIFQKSPFNAQSIFPLALLASFIGLFSGTWLNLYQQWIVFDESLSHGLFVFALFCVWFILNLQTLRRVKRPILLLFLPIAAIAVNSVLWSIFQLVDIEILAIIELPILMICVVWGLYGFKQAISMLPVLCLLVFVIPIWDYLTPILVDISGFVVGQLVGRLGMPALIEGNSILLPHGTVLIADGCSGQRYFVISITLTYIAAIMNRLPLKKGIPYFLVAALLGLITNWVRIFALVIIAYMTDMKSELLADHEFFGWVLFALIVVPFLYFIPVYKKPAENEGFQYDEAMQKPSLIELSLVFGALLTGPLLYLLSNNVTPDFKSAETLSIEGYTSTSYRHVECVQLMNV